MKRPDETLTLPHPAPVRRLVPGMVASGKWRLVEPIGAGGMGAVWLAVDTGPLGRRGAVKFLADAGPAARKRFLDEAQIMGSLHHPNIVSVIDFGIDKPTGLAWYAMDEFLPTPAETARLCREVLRCPPPAPRPGPAPLSLARLLEGGKTLPEGTVLSLARGLLSAIEAAHSLSPPVVHRDIKPSNILFAPDGRALLADFGIAKRLADGGSTRTLPGATPGTPAWAAPEQLSGGPASAATDFYSFGAVLFRALTGGMPGPTAALPVDIAPGVSRVWRKVFPRLLAADPEKRLSKSAGLRKYLDQIARDIAARRRIRPLVRYLLPAAALALLLAAAFFAHRCSIPTEPPVSAGDGAADYAELSAKTWVRRYAEALQTLLDRAVAPVPDGENRIRVGTGQVFLSGDLARGENAPAVLLDGGTFLVSPSRAELRGIAAECAQYRETAPDWAPLPDFLPAISRDTVSVPILVGNEGGELDALDTALGIDFPESLPKAPRPDGWRDLTKYDLLFTGPVRPADGLETAALRIAVGAPGITFSACDSRVRLQRLSASGVPR